MAARGPARVSPFVQWTVLDYSPIQTGLAYPPIQTGLAYLPLTAGFIVSSSISSQLFARIGTKPVIVVGTVIAAGGLYWLSRIPVDGS